ncbi:MAG: aldo/keto reductase [Gammaproteobacteria bacterium]|nr:aldo/keto reductase [Gammaproteobacteria bacterium]
MTDFFTPRQVGATSLHVTPLGFGTAWIAGPDVSLPDVVSTVQQAWDNGVRLFDTAPWYGTGRSERRLGLGLAELREDRDAFVVNTKVGRTLEPEPVVDSANDSAAADGTARTPRDGSSGFRVKFDYSYEAILQQHRDSLQRLGLSRVNSLTLHDIDRGYHNAKQLEIALKQLSTDGSAGARALSELKASGTIDAIGMGCNLETKNAFSWEDSTHEDLVERVMGLIDLDFLVIAGGYTLLETRALRRILPLCEKNNVSAIIASPFAGGWLVNPSKVGYMYSRMSGRDAPAHIQSLTNEMQDVCKEFTIPIGAAALQFVLAHPCVAAAIPGAANALEAKTTRSFLDLNIPIELWQRMRERNLLAHDAPSPDNS